jgi:hypothetical protein
VKNEFGIPTLTSTPLVKPHYVRRCYSYVKSSVVERNDQVESDPSKRVF